MQGIFITFEGLDGSGKSTHLEIADRTLRARGLPVLVVREPGGTWVGERIREILLDRTGQDMDDITELLLFASARAQNTRDVIRPALEAGRIVLCDRYTDSTVAYQGHGRGLDIGTIRRVNEIATGGLTPHRTFLFDLPAEMATGRLRSRNGEPDRMDANSADFKRRVRDGYLEIARQEPERFVVIDARGTIDETAERLSKILKEVLGL
ncbi:MAG: dTMP kinase [Clostridia bacterium]|nr:dTMP kinase [Clostridia bacterium]